MKVMLINAPYHEIYGPIRAAAGNYFPLGLGYIAAVLREGGHEVILLDPEAERMGHDRLRDRLRDEKPQLVGISCATPNFLMACKVARIAKEVTDAKVAIGGVHVSALPGETLENYPEFDIVITGEGEYTMLEIADGTPLFRVRGIYHRDKGKIVSTGHREWIKDVDRLPFPARDLVNLDNYKQSTYVATGKKSVTMITSRGCPYRCTYCASRLTLGNTFRPHSPEYVIREIEHLVKEYGIEYLVIEDDTFTADKERAKMICRMIIERKIKVSWHCLARVNTVSRDLLCLMKKAGCYSIGYGVESANEDVLRNIKKGITPTQAREAFRLTRLFNIRIMAFFMFGNPGDNKHTIRQTIDFAKELNPDLAFFNILVPYPGTEIYSDLERFGYVVHGDLKNFVAVGPVPVISTKSLSVKDLQRSVYRANMEFYARPSQMFRMLKTISTISQLKVYVTGGVGLLLQMLTWKRLSSGQDKGSD